jgi:quinol monooxygenase YgiN
MALHIIARFHVRAGAEAPALEALSTVAAATRQEPDCIDFQVFRGVRDPLLFHIHSQFRDEAAFDVHADLPHTVRFLETIEALIDQPREVTRAERLE